MHFVLKEQIGEFLLGLSELRHKLVEQLKGHASGDQSEVIKISTVIATVDEVVQLPARYDALPESIRRALEELTVSVGPGGEVQPLTDDNDEVPSPRRGGRRKSAKKSAKKAAKAAKKTAKKKGAKKAAKKTGTRKKTAAKGASGSKVDHDTRVKIAADLKNGDSPKDIASRYGVSPQAVGNVRRFGP